MGTKNDTCSAENLACGFLSAAYENTHPWSENEGTGQNMNELEGERT